MVNFYMCVVVTPKSKAEAKLRIYRICIEDF